MLARVDELAHRYLDGAIALLAERIARGRIVDGHGDLLADDIFCLDDGPRILDWLEFDDRLRWGDVLYDVGFLAMDLEHLGRRDLALHFLDWYREFSAETHPPSLEHHYIAYRALVRSKIACLRGRRRRSDRGDDVPGPVPTAPPRRPGAARRDRRSARHGEVDARRRPRRRAGVARAALGRDPQGAGRTRSRQTHRRPPTAKGSTRRR